MFRLQTALCTKLLMLALSTVGLARAAGAQTIAEQYLLAAANQSRAEHQLPPVRLELHLCRAAAFHAHEMANHGTISHQFEGEPDLAARASSAGAHFSLVTENVAEASNAALIHELWMHSPGHRANLLDPKVDTIGIAVESRNGQLYAAEDFSRTVESLSLEEQENAVGRLLERAGVSLAGNVADARRTCTLSTGYAGERQPWFVMRYTAGDLKRLPEELTARLASSKYHVAAVGACAPSKGSPFTSYSVAVLLYP